MYCPVDSSGTRDKYPNKGHYVAGCGPLALSQLVRYYQRPEKGLGAVTYTTSLNQTISMNFDTCVFNWQHMPMVVDTNSPEIDQRSIAFLIYTVGVMFRTDFGPDSSEAIGDYIFRELHTRLGYSGYIGIFGRENYPSGQFDSLITGELIKQRPVIYKGTGNNVGHFFIIDGFVKRNGRVLYHSNAGNGQPGTLAPLDSIAMENIIYNENQRIITHFTPPSLPTPQNLRCEVDRKFVYIRWDPVQDSNVCGYRLYQWNNNGLYGTTWRCGNNQTELFLTSNSDTSILNSTFPDSVKEIAFNVVAINRDSTGSQYSNTLIITRDDCFPASVVSFNHETNFRNKLSCRIMGNCIKVMLLTGGASQLKEMAIYSLNGSLIQKVSHIKQLSPQNFSIPVELPHTGAAQVILRVNLSDGSKITQPIILNN